MSYNVYLGGQSDLNVNPTTAVPLIIQPRDPNQYDNKNFSLGWHWLNKSSGAMWYLASLANGFATWLELSGGLGNVISLTGNVNGRVYPTAGNINVVGDGITVTVVGTPGSSTLTISALGTGTTETLTGDTGGAVSPLAGNINVQEGMGNGTSFFSGDPATHTLTLVYSTLVSGNTVLGTNAFLAPMSGAVDNSGVGISVLSAITTGEDNCAFGAFVLENNTTGSKNTGIGATALVTNIAGDDNTAVGFAVLTDATGSQNSGVGSSALANLSSGQQNVAVGYNALNALTTSGNNVAIGASAMVLATSSGTNVAVGSLSLSALLTGSDNTCLGYGTGSTYASDESSNICIGYNVNGVVGDENTLRIGTSTGSSPGQLSAAYIQGIAGVSVSNQGVVTINTVTGQLGSINSGVLADSFVTDDGTATPSFGVLNVKGGTSARDINTSGSGSTIHIDLNNAITLGDLSGIAANSGAVTAQTGDIIITAGDLTLPVTNSAGNQGIIKFGGNRWISNYGTRNTFVGQGAGNTSLTTGSAIGNVGIGDAVLASLTTGLGNTAVGSTAMTALTSGTVNVAVGINAAAALTTGSGNTFIGQQAGLNSTTASNSTMVGLNAGGNLTTGINNCLIGYQAGLAYTGAEGSNIIIGNNIPATVGESNVMRIGLNTGVLDNYINKTFIAGIRGITTVNANAIAVLVDSSGQLGTVSSSIRYKENVDDMGPLSKDIYQLRPVVFNYKQHDPESKSVGLIAEEVEKVMPSLVVHDDYGNVETVKYHDLVPMLLNELQRLEKRVTELESK